MFGSKSRRIKELEKMNFDIQFNLDTIYRQFLNYIEKVNKDKECEILTLEKFARKVVVRISQFGKCYSFQGYCIKNGVREKFNIDHVSPFMSHDLLFASAASSIFQFEVKHLYSEYLRMVAYGDK